MPSPGLGCQIFRQPDLNMPPAGLKCRTRRKQDLSAAIRVTLWEILINAHKRSEHAILSSGQ
jgi:hypothetical protein